MFGKSLSNSLFSTEWNGVIYLIDNRPQGLNGINNAV